MKNIQEQVKRIGDLTLKIEQAYPELYQYLMRVRVLFSFSQHLNTDPDKFSDY
jgi:hypothetical protein